MTITELRGEARDFAHEHWWNGASVAVVLFLIVSFIWKRPDNDFLLYAALIAVGAHGYISATCFERKRVDRQYRQELAVAYRDELQREQSHVTDRPLAGRPGGLARPAARPASRLVAAASR